MHISCRIGAKIDDIVSVPFWWQSIIPMIEMNFILCEIIQINKSLIAIMNVQQRNTLCVAMLPPPVFFDFFAFACHMVRLGLELAHFSCQAKEEVAHEFHQDSEQIFPS